MTHPFSACGGQGKGLRQWSVCYDVPGREWWRPETATGRVRLWASSKAAQAYADTLSVIGVELALARQAAERLLEAAAEGSRHMASLNRYAGVRAAYWGRDPAGLFTADIAHLSAVR